MFRWLMQSRVETRCDLARRGGATSPQMLRYINYVGFQTMKNFYKQKPDKVPRR